MIEANIEVRPLTLAEVDVLLRVDPDVFDDEVRLEWARDYLADPRAHLAVAIVDGVVIGMASGLVYNHPDKPRQLFLNEVGVAEPYRRRGVGRRLIETLLEAGRAAGCVEAWVATETDNHTAREFYAALGGREEPSPAVVYTFRWDGR
jgi:ribosomal protein S18 acetylase RimI-like enzyme